MSIIQKLNHSKLILDKEMSYSFTLSGNSSVLSYDFNPPIYLDVNSNFEIELVNFNSFNTIPNIDETNNLFSWGPTTNKINDYKIPVGAYELDDIIKILKKCMRDVDPNAWIEIKPNLNTQKLSIISNQNISFNSPISIGKIFGFINTRRIEPNKITYSDNPIKILKVNSLGIDCSIATGSYLNGKPGHVIHYFFPTVPYGYKIVESPQNILYYPVSVKTINNIVVKIIDQSGNLVNFQEEEITVTLHIRKSE